MPGVYYALLNHPITAYDMYYHRFNIEPITIFYGTIVINMMVSWPFLYKRGTRLSMALALYMDLMVFGTL